MMMTMGKKIVWLVFPFLLLACGDNVEVNTPSIQGEANNQFFHAFNSEAVKNSNNEVTLSGSEGLQKITLQISSQAPAVYDLSKTGNKATFQSDSTFYSTENGPGGGQIEIIKLENDALYGSFYFNAYSDEQQDTLIFERGDFFKVPIISQDSDEPTTDAPEQ